VLTLERINQTILTVPVGKRLIGGKRGELPRERGKDTTTAQAAGKEAGKAEGKRTGLRDGFMRMMDK